MNLKCIGTNVSEIEGAGGVKAPVYTATLAPTGGGQGIRLTGPAGSAAATMVYGKTYSLTEVA